MQDNISTNSIVSVGLRIREARNQRGLSLAELASRTGLSKGLLSKIENFRAIPSLPVLVAIARGLHVEVAELVGGIKLNEEKSCVLIRAGAGAQVDRDEAEGFCYEALLVRPVGAALLETFVLTLAPGAKRKRVSTNGEQLVHVLAGDVDFMIGKQGWRLHVGDTLFFDGRIPHVPRNAGIEPARLLALYFVDQEEK